MNKPTAAQPLDLDEMAATVKEALRDLSHVESHLEQSDAPTTVRNRAVDVRLCINELQAALIAQARTARLDTTASASDACAEMRALCSNCGGTGEVHRADGEYIGTCDCMFQTIASPPPSTIEMKSINTPEFQALAGTWCGASQSCDQWTRTVGAKQAWADMIAYIDSRATLAPVAAQQAAAQTNSSSNSSSNCAAKAPAAQADDLRLAICDIPLPVYGSDSFQHGFVSCKEAALDLLSKRAASPASTPEASQQAAAVAAPSDEQIIAALHANGIDTYPSKYGFDAVQVSATSVPSLRNVFAALYATAVAATTSEDARDAALLAIGKLIATQDNRYTDQPMFIVQQRRRITGLDTDYCENIVWLCSEDDYSEANEEEAAQLEAEYQETGRTKSGWCRTGYSDTWEFVTACFTEQGCKDYLARNGHNLKEPRIYAEGSYRNEEFRTIRNWLHSLAAAPSPAAVDGAKEEQQTLAQVQADEAELYRDLTGDAVKLGYDGIAAALIALCEIKAGQQAAPEQADIEKLTQDAIKAAGNWAAAEYEDAGNKGKGGPGNERQCDRWELKTRLAIKALARCATQAPAIAADRDAVLEEAAKVCSNICKEYKGHAKRRGETDEEFYDAYMNKSLAASECMEAIRALKSTSSAASQAATNTQGDKHE